MKIFVKDSGTSTEHYFPEADGYSPGAGEAEVADITLTYEKGLRLLGQPNLENFTDLRSRIDTLVAAKTFASCDAGEKDIASACFVVDKADRDTVHSAAQQAANAKAIADKVENDRSRKRQKAIQNSIKDASKAQADASLDKCVPKTYGAEKELNISTTTYTVYAKQIVDFDQGKSDIGTLYVDLTYVDRAISVKVTDAAEGTTYGETNGIAASGVASVALTNLPLSGVDNLRIHVKKDTSAGTNPDIHQFILYHG